MAKSLVVSCWLVTNLQQGDRYRKTLFGVTCWSLWFWRNNCMFGDTSASWHETIRSIYYKVDEILRSYGLLKQSASRDQCKWEPLDDGWMKLNCDGAVRPEEGKATAAGVCPDTKGDFHWDFQSKLGCCTPITAELWGVKHGLHQA
ncbi:hypothetical protein Scep_019937 [Stephania cephalantha]|uniref:RNase H type-1 domain-containing protein n=1 Tax=Stephania cephalantha TaxID=152367 RepID=A0AAP0NMN3_9MAGN